jgi:cardiolipin synthase A/B
MPPAEAGGLWQDARIFTAVGATLDTARTRVLVEMYEFGRHDLVLALIAARARGAAVRVILDPTVPPTLIAGRQLAAAGVPVRFYPVDDHALQIDHVKLLVGDDQALVGGMNWGATSARNHDYALLLRAPVAGSIAQTAPGTEIRPLLEATLASARVRIEAEVFDLTDPDLLLLLEQASRRGVGVRVLLDPAQDVNRPSYAELRRTHVQVRWFRPTPGAKLHAKAVLADDRLVLGSANWSHHGLDVNHELEVTTGDAAAVATYAARFEADWQAA